MGVPVRQNPIEDIPYDIDRHSDTGKQGNLRCLGIILANGKERIVHQADVGNSKEAVSGYQCSIPGMESQDTGDIAKILPCTHGLSGGLIGWLLHEAEIQTVQKKAEDPQSENTGEIVWEGQAI